MTIPHTALRFLGAGLVLLSVTAVEPVPLLSQRLNASPALGRTKSMAETQHEIVMLLIRKKEYSKAVSEARKIFDLKWPEDHEPLLLRELLILSDQFLHHGQASFGLEMIEKNAKSFKAATSQIAILKEKGYLHKCLGHNDKALDAFREAKRLEDRD